MCEKDRLDLLIDAAIATYAEPPAELAEHVLQSLGTAREAGAVMPPRAALRRIWLPWAIALPLAACALLALVIDVRAPQHETQARNHSSPPHQRTVVTPDAPAKREVHRTWTHTPKSRARHDATEMQASALPKLDVFPTPQPLNAEVRALVAIATQTPVPLRKALVESQLQPDAPLRIAEISIPPIKPPDQVQP